MRQKLEAQIDDLTNQLGEDIAALTKSEAEYAEALEYAVTLLQFAIDAAQDMADSDDDDDEDDFE